MDFDDLLMVTVNLFDSFEDVLAAYRSRFAHVLVDEFQDTNRAQNELVLRLGAEHRNVTVVGDVDQSIYRWRGADIRNLLEFEEAFPDAAVVALEQNYRSTKTILDVANAVIVNNVSRVPKDLWTDVGDGDPVCRYRAEDERDEALWVASEIGAAPPGRGAPLRRHRGVLPDQRTEPGARRGRSCVHGIPYKVVGGTRFYDRREVRDVLAYLKVLLNPADEVSCRRIVNVPKRGSRRRVGRPHRDLGPRRTAARSPTRSSQPEAAGLSGQGGQGRHVPRGAARRAEVSSPRRDASPAAIVEAVLHRTGYGAELRARSTRRVRRKAREPDRAPDRGGRVRHASTRSSSRLRSSRTPTSSTATGRGCRS